MKKSSNKETVVSHRNESYCSEGECNYAKIPLKKWTCARTLLS